MKRILLLTIILFIGKGILFAQDTRRTITPDSLAAIINSGADSDMLILNTGPVDDIKHAINIGAVSDAHNVKKLKKYLRKTDKDKSIVIYCGCCPFAGCPNIDPAYDLLAKMGFTNFRALKLDDDLKIDWIDKGYPMQE